MENYITLMSTDPALVKAYTEQYQEHLSLCSPVFVSHTDSGNFSSYFSNIRHMKGTIFEKSASLSVCTLPRELLHLCIQQTDDKDGKKAYELYLNEIPEFEKRLSCESYVDIAPLATAAEIRTGKIPVPIPFGTCASRPCYTPETYILHLKNILRLMEQYENYRFFPFPNKFSSDYHLIVNEFGLALLTGTSVPELILEIHNGEIMNAYQEHLHQFVEQLGSYYTQKENVRAILSHFISELSES